MESLISITDELQEGPSTFVITSRRVLLRIRMCYTKVVEKIRTLILCSENIFFSENHAVLEISQPPAWIQRWPYGLHNI